MKTKSFLITTFLLLISSLTYQAYAQFQGKIEMKTYSENKGNIEENVLNMFVTENRIMIQGEEDFNIADNVEAGGLLIRNDKSDFVLMIDDNQAIQVTKAEIEGLIEMFASWGGNSQQQEEESEGPGYRFSDRTKTILGKESAEMIIDNEDNPDKHLSIWLTPNIDINWGMLAEPWKNIPDNMQKEFNNMSQDLLFRGKNFPMLIEAHDGENVETIFEVTSLEETSVAKAMVEIPSGITLIGAKEYMFNMMMQQQ